MGEIAEMMLDGTMDPETGEWNFDGEDGPGFPMTGAQARAWKKQNHKPVPMPARVPTPNGARTGGEPSPYGKGLSKNARRRRNRYERQKATSNPGSTTR